MTRLFILQVVLFFDWSILSNGEDALEEPSHDRFVLHIPIPITTLKHTHAVLKITQNNGKKLHDLEIHHPKHHSISSHQHKHNVNRDHKRGSNKRTQQHSKTSKNEQKQAKKAKHTQDKSTEEQHLNSGRGKYPRRQEHEDRNEDLFNRYFSGKFKHDVKHSSKVSHQRPAEYVFRHSGRTGRSHNADGYNKFARERKKAYTDNKRNKNGQYRTKQNFGKTNKNGRVRSKDGGHFNGGHSDEADTETHSEEDEEPDGHFEDASFNFESVTTKTPNDSIDTKLPQLHPSWADEGLVSPFALNDVLFKDKKYNKKVFKELGWYPLFLPYEVMENQE